MFEEKSYKCFPVIASNLMFLSFSAFSISGLHTYWKPAKWKCGIICLKNRTSTIKSTKIYIKIFFSFLLHPLPKLGMVVLLFYVNNVKIKNKILLLERILSFILTLCNILCPLSSAPTRALTTFKVLQALDKFCLLRSVQILKNRVQI